MKGWILLGWGIFAFSIVVLAAFRSVLIKQLIQGVDEVNTRSNVAHNDVIIFIDGSEKKGSMLEAYTWTVHGKAKFVDLAKRLEGAEANMTDKVTTHSYQTMYGKFLFPMLWKANVTGIPVKFLEIGLGCDMGYGPGKSVKVWQNFWGSNAEIWFGEYNAACVTAEQKAGRLQGINVVTGDQGDKNTLTRWLKETGGNFDVIIDDGGHTNAQIQTTFQVLFENALNPGGLYFIEDLQVGRFHPYYLKGSKFGATTELIQDWIDQLSINGYTQTHQRTIHHKIPAFVDWIFCQREACIVAKCALGDKACENKHLR